MKPTASPALWIGDGALIRPGLTALGAKTKLYEEGFELLGTGACAAAFQLGDSDRCAKLVCDRAGHRAAVQMFRDHPEVEAFPRVYGYVELAGDCFAYETELLEDAGTYHDFAGDPVDEWIDWEGVGNTFGGDAASILRDVCEGTVLFATNEGVERCLYFDLHDENFMERPDGDLVVIDPFNLRHERDGRSLSTVQGNSGACHNSYWGDVQGRAKRRGAEIIQPVLRAV